MLFSVRRRYKFRQMYKENPERLAWILWGAMALLALGLLLFSAADETAQPVVSDQLLRLHVVANSDTPEDQRVKLLVRDAIQAEFAAQWADMGSADACRLQARQSLSAMEECARRVLAAHGLDYSVHAKLGVYPFPQRVYEDTVTLPEGRYWAVRMTLGKGEGQNWWCVLYPPLCASLQTEEETPQVRSWIWENLPQSWKDCLERFWTGERAS